MLASSAMSPAAPDTSLSVVAICLILFGLPIAWAVWQYVKDARAYRAGRGDEQYAWLRRNHPGHPALPPPPPKPMLRLLPRRWGWRVVVIYLVQAAAIVWIIWSYAGIYDLKSDPKAGQALALLPFFAVLLVAFTTALLTRLWDTAAAMLGRRRARSGESGEPGREVESGLAVRRRLHEGP